MVLKITIKVVGYRMVGNASAFRLPGSEVWECLPKRENHRLKSSDFGWYRKGAADILR